jgi:cytochrome P450
MSAENVACQSADTDRAFDPSTYAEGVPFGALARLRRERPGLWVEARLRWWTPVMTCRRTAVSDCRRGSVESHAGHKGVVSSTSANRDEAVFADPDRLAIRRHPNPHLGFGPGPPFCWGTPLARVPMRALVTEVLTRMGHLEYDGKPAYLRSNFQRDVKRLPVRGWRRGGSC